MKRLFVVIASCALLFLGTFAAAQSAHDSHSGPGAPEGPAGATEPEASEQEMGRHMEMMQGIMQGMKARMEKIKASTDPQERRELMKAHMGDMEKGLVMMKSMPKCPMMSGNGMMGQGQGMMGSGMMKCRQMMHGKMEMMQMMMEGLLESAKMKE